MNSSIVLILSVKYLWIVFFIISCFFTGTFSDIGKSSSLSINKQNHFQDTGSISQFITKNNTRVIAQKGGLAILPCAVKLSSHATVSWVRRKDFQLLTVGLSTHSTDGRFLVEHTRHMGHWSLRIKSVRDDDRGLYECQLSIYPTQSIFVELRVVEAIAEIAGAPDLHIDEGSTLRLECKLKRATENPAFVFWYHDDKMVNYDSQDGFSVTSTSLNNNPSISSSSSQHNNNNNNNYGVGNGMSNSDNNNKNYLESSSSSSSSSNSNSYSSTNTLQPSVTQSYYLTTPSTSLLTIKEVHFNHAGNYTCKPSNARQTSITVHVLRGEKPAAMQHANRSNIIDDNSKSQSSSSSGATKWFAQNRNYTIFYYLNININIIFILYNSILLIIQQLLLIYNMYTNKINS